MKETDSLFLLHVINKNNEGQVVGVFNDLKIARKVAESFLDVPVKSLSKIKKDIDNGVVVDLHTTRGVRGCLAWKHRRVWIEFVKVNEAIELGRYFLGDN